MRRLGSILAPGELAEPMTLPCRTCKTDVYYDSQAAAILKHGSNLLQNQGGLPFQIDEAWNCSECHKKLMEAHREKDDQLHEELVTAITTQNYKVSPECEAKYGRFLTRRRDKLNSKQSYDRLKI